MDDDDDAISAPNGRITAADSQPVTVAAPPTHHHHALALALPIQQPRVAGGLPTATPAGGGGGREDCWSEGATSVLIDAWGERYMELSRGNLKQQHWREVSDIVSSRDDYTKPHKTDVQCKNRIDTLKKKYKVEKAKIASGGGPSKWPFFLRLDRLIGSSPHNAKTPPAALPPPSRPAQIPPPRPPLQHFVRNPPPPPAAEVNSASSSEGLPPEPTRGKKRRETGDEAAVKELTRAILRFGEVYEKVETSKLQQATEMEKQRMGFAKELELQRMQFFLKTQLELTKMKRGKVSGNNNSLNNHQHHHHHQNNDSDDDESDIEYREVTDF